MPPKLRITVSIARSSACPPGSETCAATITDCGAPGRSMRYTRFPEVAGTDWIRLAGACPGFHALNARSSSGSSAAIVVSPVTITVALPGWNQSRCHVTRSPRVSADTVCS